MRLRPEYDFSDSDLDFIVREAEPGASEQTREELKRLVCEDEAFREGMVGCDRVFRKVMGDAEVFLKISARLFFEILIRRAAGELASAGHTVEREGRHRIFVLDSDDVIELLNQYPVVYYLADVLASFSRTESYVVRMRTRRGVWRRVRFNGMDVHSMIRLCSAIDKEQRPPVFKRIADLCLFMAGVFPEYAQQDGAAVGRGKASSRRIGSRNLSLEEFEQEGRRFYRLAAEHPVNKEAGWAEAHRLLEERFPAACKPLNYVAANFLQFKKGSLFGGSSP